MSDPLSRSPSPVPISLYTGGDPPPFQPGPLNFDYVLAGNGLFLRACQGGLEISVPVTSLRGLPPLVPAIRWDYPLIPAALVQEIVTQALLARDLGGGLVEILFYLVFEYEGWQLHIPDQEQRAGSVIVREPGAFVRTQVELHSHGALRPYFSPTDNRGEGLLRIYAVMGGLETHPAIKVRIGAYGVYQMIPAGMVFDLAGTELVDGWFDDALGELWQKGSDGDGPAF